MQQGIIVKNISNQYDCLINDKIITCTPRGLLRHNNQTPLVGDYVLVNPETKIINSILERKNELKRPPVANVDMALIVTSVKEPELSLNLLDHQLVLVKSNNIIPIIVLTKLDLLNKTEKQKISEIIKYYKKNNYLILKNTDKFKLKHLIKHKIVVLTGQTGAGKSTLINSLDKTKSIKTQPISQALGRGVHTTRNSEIYKIKNFYIMDTPGFSSLDLSNLEPNTIKKYFHEFKNYECKFKDCNHEKNCEVTRGVEENKILKSRYENYLKIYKECYEASSKLFK